MWNISRMVVAGTFCTTRMRFNVYACIVNSLVCSCLLFFLCHVERVIEYICYV